MAKSNNENASSPLRSNYDVAAYIWPSYHDDPKSRLFWPEEYGEWQSVKAATPRYPGHLQPKRPLWGYQNEADPRTMEMQIDAAADHGVNVFIYDWYWYDRGPFLESCLNDGFLKARNRDRVKFFIMWANHDANTCWDTRARTEQVVWRADWDFEEFKIIARRMIEKYFSQPNYYTIDGKPVFCIYQLSSFINGIGSVAKAAQALAWFREECVRSGLSGLHLQTTLRRGFAQNATGVSGDDQDTQSSVISEMSFDSVTHYQWVHVAGAEGEYQSWGEEAIKSWETFSEIPGVDLFPHVSVGWDNTPRYIETRQLVKGRTPEAFHGFLQKAKAFLNERNLRAPLVTVNSWNEWTEDSYLLPDRDFGYAYLEAVRDVFLKP